ncbi:MAG: glycosyltransferase family 4 protein [Methermicoccaceae archaeon]
MRVCMYADGERLFRQSGIGTAIRQFRKALVLNGVELVDDWRDADIVHIHTITPMSAYISKVAKSSKVVMHAHTTSEDFRDSFIFSDYLSPVLARYLKALYSSADLVLCPSEHTYHVLRSHGITNEMRIISNGVDIDAFTQMEQRRERERKRLGLSGVVPFSVGNVFLRKGVDVFVDVAKGLDNTFVWYGAISKLADPRALRCVREAPPNVVFAGFVEDVVDAYAAGDVFFFPSREENQGIAVLEAAAARKPLLLSRIPAFDYLEEEKSCLKASSTEEFAQKLERLIEDGSLRESISRAAYEVARTHDLKTIGAVLKGYYEELLSR